VHHPDQGPEAGSASASEATPGDGEALPQSEGMVSQDAEEATSPAEVAAEPSTAVAAAEDDGESEPVVAAEVASEAAEASTVALAVTDTVPVSDETVAEEPGSSAADEVEGA